MNLNENRVGAGAPVGQTPQAGGAMTMVLEEAASTTPAPIAAFTPPPAPVILAVPPVATSEDAGDEEPGSFFDMFKFNMREAPGWALSLGVHLLVFTMLAGIRSVTVTEKDTTITSVIDELERTPEFDVAMHDQVGDNANVTSLTSAASMATQSGNTPENQFSQELDEQNKLEVPVVDQVDVVPEAEVTGHVNIKGGGTENVVGGTEGAIDRLTLELRSSLSQKKTLVIWLFDASQSLRARRNAIADRFENVYQQLDSLDPNTEKSLKTVVATFGEKTNILTKDPVDDVRSIIPKVRAIPDDVSGKENVFAAVGQVTRDFQKYRSSGRNVLIFIVTDERGDDIDKLEDTIHQARRHAIKVYVVGNASLFGREQGFVRWTYPDKSEEDVAVDLGPETIAPEALQLGFWGNSSINYDRMSSGYGPYGLTRLCKETGGLYFIAEEGQGPKFNPAIMRNYAPDYRPIKDYQLALSKNKAKSALVMAATKTKVDNIPIPRIVFRADTDNALREEITESQKPAALVDAKVNEMVNILAAGEKDREKITEPRWRAAFDLAYGRALAMRVRYFGYNTVLTEMKGLPKSFTKKGNNQWKLVPSKNIAGGPAVKKIEKQATTYLKRVVDEHPGTPWAMLAEQELTSPLGWEWQEASADYVKMDRAQAAAKQVRLADDEKKKEAAKKGMPIPGKVPPKL